MTVRAILFDFYGTLAEATHWVSTDSVLAEHGFTLAPETRDRWFNDGIDGFEHLEHSQSRDHYVAWQRERTLGMLSETDVHPGEHEAILQKLRDGSATRVLEAYVEVPQVLDELREQDLRLAICSNWDWDLAEAVDDAGLTGRFDVQMSSAWAGARKPHPRIYARTLEKVGATPDEVLFVGDSWGPDVAGPLEYGMAPVYIIREGHWPDPTAPENPEAQGIPVIRDLHGVLDMVLA